MQVGKLLVTLLALSSAYQIVAEATSKNSDRAKQIRLFCNRSGKLPTAHLPSICHPRRLQGISPEVAPEGPDPNASSQMALLEELMKPVQYKAPTRAEAEEIRRKCTAPMQNPQFQPWEPPPEYFRAELWSIRTMVGVKDNELKDFYMSNEKYYLDQGSHLDHRFLDEKKLKDHTWVQKRFVEMLSRFMEFCDRLEFHPIIAHGSLLGLSWTNRMTEYDDDIDLQIAYQELEAMLAWNQTILGDDFLLDINPHFRDRHIEFMDNNVIDARVIDKTSGIFIDITALSDMNPNIWPMKVTCKSPHVYAMNSLFPLRRSMFEGIEVWIPNDVTSVLSSEYQSQGYGVGPYRDGWRFNLLNLAWEQIKKVTRFF